MGVARGLDAPESHIPPLTLATCAINRNCARSQCKSTAGKGRPDVRERGRVSGCAMLPSTGTNKRSQRPAFQRLLLRKNGQQNGSATYLVDIAEKSLHAERTLHLGVDGDTDSGYFAFNRIRYDPSTSKYSKLRSPEIQSNINSQTTS